MNDSIKSLSFNFIIVSIIFGAVTLLNSCQNDPLQEHTITPEITSLEVQKAFLQFTSNVPIEKMTQEQIEETYEEAVKNMPVEHQNRLMTLIEEGLSKTPASNNNFNAAKKSETILESGVNGDGYGQSIAISGGRIYVGARHTQEVFEYQKSGGSYTLINTLTPSSPTEDFGYQVSVSGSWMAVGAPEYGPPYPSGEGKVFMFENVDGVWVEHSIVDGPSGKDNFGGPGLVLKGNQMVVVNRDLNFPSPGGDLRVFNYDGTNWVLTATIHKPGYDWIGIDMDNGGNRIIGTGSINFSFVNVFATIFVKTSSGWVEEDEVNISGANPFEIVFPRDVAIDGNKAVLTAVIPGHRHWVLSNNNGDWDVEQEINIPIASLSNRWTAMHGSKVLIGKPSFTNSENESIYVFNKSGGLYNLAETLSPSDGGIDVTMTSLDIQGNRIAVGAVGGSGGVTGRLYVFD